VFEPKHPRVTRELFLAAFRVNVTDLEPWVTDRLTSILEEDTAARGETIFSAGEPPDFIYFVREGRVDIVGGAATRSLEGPRILGLFDALLDRQRTRSAVAATDLPFMRVRTEAWMELLEDSFALARASVLGMARAVADAEERLWAGSAPQGPESPAAFTLPAERLTVVERMAFLLDVPLLGGAGVQAMSDLATVSDEVAVAEGETLFRSGERQDRIFALLDGQVTASREAPHVEWRGGRGDIVCGAASFADSAVAWEARATSRVRAITFRVEDWFDLMETHFEMLRATLAALATQSERLTE
jgi:CRP-like cAMP-binding protein